jgi:hypothetical protein
MQLAGDLAALPDPQQPAAGGVGDPQRPLGVEAAAVGSDLHLGEDLADRPIGRQRPELRPDAAVGQPAVRRQVEGGAAVAERLVHDEHPVGR